MNEWGIKSRVLFLTLVPTIIISLLLSAYFTSTRLQDLETALKDRGYAIALQLAPASEYGVFSGNMHTLQRIANDAMSEPEVRSVSIFNKDGQLLAHAGHEHKTPSVILSVTNQANGITMADTGNSLLFTVPVTIRDVIIEDFPYTDNISNNIHHDNVIGWISIELGRMTTTLRQYQVLFACSIIVLIGLAISGVFAFRMGRDVTRPIQQMAFAVEKIKNGNFDTRVYTNARGELRHLEAGINTMAASLKSAHEEMQQSVEQATADLRQTLETIEIQNIELEMARKEAEAAARVKSEFLANMSHEIRTPLNGVIGFINLLMKTPLNSRQKDYLQTIHKSATSLLSIINDILDFSKIEAGKLRLDPSPMDIRECIEDALTLLAPSAHDKALELVPLVYSDVPEKIIGDHLRLRQIITNLVNNAIKFTESGSVVVRVSLEKESDQNVVVCVQVSDSGIGLSTEEQKSLFQAFKQADSTTTRKFGGTGLGLVISKRLVQQMGGEIGVESVESQGSTFWFTFLADKVDEIEDMPSHPKLAGKNVLIFEQHETSRLALSHFLQSMNMTVETIDNRDDIEPFLLNAERTNKLFDMVLVGINQPDPNGDYVESMIRLVTGTYHVPIGVLANTTSQIIYDDILNAGAKLCLSKPFRRKKLHDGLVEALLNEHVEDDSTYLANMNQVVNSGNIHLLAVDDYPANLKLVSALLEDMGVPVSVAESGQQALELVEKHRFDLILMDIQMPGMDGIEATNHIRELEPPGQHTPIIALTAHALLSEREALLNAGMDDYLTKPIGEKDLKRVIEKWSKNHAFSSDKKKVQLEVKGTKDAVNWKLCMKLANNKTELAHEMLRELVNSLRKDQSKINDAFAQNDLALTRELVHRLHGACCYSGVPFLKRATAALEKVISENHVDKIQHHMVIFNKEVTNVLDFVKKHPEYTHPTEKQIAS